MTGDVIFTMQLACNRLTMRQFSCALGAQYVSYGWESLQYRHEPLSLTDSSVANAPDPPVDSNPTHAQGLHHKTVGAAGADALPPTLPPDPTKHPRHTPPDKVVPDGQHQGGSRGIAMVIHPGVLASAYASIRWLRHDLNCSLPLEVWFKPDEMARTHPVLVALVSALHVTPREIHHPLATRFFTKPYSLFYSAFDNVLLVDCDNFAVRNPEFLFDEPAFLATGALFWPVPYCHAIESWSSVSHV
ncbi:hypothetical protein DYB32_010451, partial [Aphanomyces invadans]